MTRGAGGGETRYRLRRRSLRIRAAAGVHPVDDALFEPVHRIPVRKGERVLDLGCGTGLYGLAAACLGAGEVVLTDIDPRAVACARANARRNGIGNARFASGDFLEPVAGERFDVICAQLPQTPAPSCFSLAKWGGPSGTDHLDRLLREAPAHLNPGGRLYLLLIDLADTERFLRRARRRFTLRTVHSSRRSFSPDEYEAYLPGLFAYLESLRRRGRARFARGGFRRRFVVATLRD